MIPLAISGGCQVTFSFDALTAVTVTFTGGMAPAWTQKAYRSTVCCLSVSQTASLTATNRMLNVAADQYAV